MYSGDWLYKRSILTPNHIAVCDADSGEGWTYKQLNDRAEHIAAYFINKGVCEGDRVALLAVNHISYFDFLFACYKIGAIFVPLNWRLSSNELAYIIQDCSPKIIGVHSKFEHSFVCEHPIDCLLITNSYYESIKESARELPVNVREDDRLPVVIIYTGGTTGYPKGVILSRKTILANALNTIVSWGLASTDVTLSSLPMFHTGGLNALTIPILMAGGKVVYYSEFEAEQALRYLDRFSCTIALFVPTMYHLMISTSYFYQSSFPSMKEFLSGGAPCPIEVYHAFSKKGLPFKEGYGLSEAGPNNFFISVDDSVLKKGSVGKPMILNDVKLMDGANIITDAEKVGELLIAGAHTFSGYWKNDKAYNEVFRNGWLYTGDLAKMDEEGYFYIVGRKKDMIITGGENVYPIEVEQVLLAHPCIEEAAVIGVKDEKWGEIVTAFVVSNNHNIQQKEVEDYCASLLARYKVPKVFQFLKSLPKTHIGKIDKNSLHQKVSTNS